MTSGEHQRLVALVERARKKVLTYADEQTYGDNWRVLRKNYRGVPLSAHAIFGQIVRSASALAMRSMASLVTPRGASETALAASSTLDGARTAFANVLTARVSAWVPIQRAVVFQTVGAVADVDAMHGSLEASLFHALALGERALASHLAEKLSAGFRGRGREHALSFALALHARWQNSDSAPRPLGRYAAVFDAWTDTTALAGALSEVCTEHLRRIRFCDEYDAQWDNGYELCPIEIAALRVVREHEGLETPVIEHPLLFTPCAAIPRGPMAYEPQLDDLLAEAARLAREIAPNAAAAIDECLCSRPSLPPPISGRRIRVEPAEREPSAFARAAAWLAFERPPAVDPELDAVAFAELALDSTGGVALDWKLTHNGVLEELEELGISVELTIDPKWSRDELMRAATRQLDDGRTAVRLRQFDDSDMDGYLLLHGDSLRGIREELGERFDAVFQELERV